MRLLRRLLGTVVLACGILSAGAALALPVWYGELWTSKVHAELTVPTYFSNPLDMLSAADLNLLGGGYGNSRVTTSSPLVLTHTFAPDGYDVNAVLKASVYVMVIDDFDLAPETAEIQIDGTQIAGGGIMFARLFGGNVGAWIATSDDSFILAVTAPRGDFNVLGTGLSVHFDGSQPPSAPEPAAALVFATGLVVVSRVRRRAAA